jgi:hypothetical protein
MKTFGLSLLAALVGYVVGLFGGMGWQSWPLSLCWYIWSGANVTRCDGSCHIMLLRWHQFTERSGRS